MDQMADPAVDWADVQGEIFQPYGHDFSAHLLLGFPTPAKGLAFLAALKPTLTTADKWADNGESCRNLGISYSGFASLGLDDAELLSFPFAFRRGMAKRAAALGDTGASAPDKWDTPYGSRAVHAWLMVTGRTAEVRDAALADASALAAANGVEVLLVEMCDDLTGPGNRTKDHFGYDDGVGQPAVAGAPGPSWPGQGSPPPRGQPGLEWTPIALGAFLCGYPNEIGFDPPFPATAALRRGGTFMAYRKLEEHVADFRRFLEDNKGAVGGDSELLAAKLVGRWRSGAPLELSPDHDDPPLGSDPARNENFGYADDPEGLRVPLCAHIRRANPRDSLPKGSVISPRLHRIIRRKMPYGPWLAEGAADDGQRRGIVFRAYNADLTAQFEMVQALWLGSANDAGALSSDQDPIAGLTDPVNPPPKGLGSSFAIPREDAIHTLYDLPRFVTLKGGEYFFLPALSAIEWVIAQGKTP